MAPKAKPAAAKAKPEAKAKAKAEAKKKEEPRPEDLIPKVSPPNNEEFEERLQAVQAEVEKLQEKQKELNKRISERSGGKDEFQQKRAELRAELDHWSNLLDGIRNEKEDISKQLGDQAAEGVQKRNELAKMKKSIGFGSEAEIDERIAHIEWKMSTTSMPLKEEKELMKEMAELKKSRPKVAQVKSLEGALATGDRGASLKETRKELGARMGQYLEEKRKVSEKLKALMEERKNETGDLPALIEERDALGGKIRELNGKRREIRDEKRQQEQAYYAYQAEIRKLRQERAAEERTARQKEYEDRKKMKEAEKLDEQPYTSEITLVEQTLAFCQNLVKEKASEEAEEKKETVHTNPDGYEVLGSKKDRDDEYYFVPTKQSKKGKSKAAKTASTSKSIKHTAETFQLFSKLGLDAPITTADVPDLMEKLEAQLNDYKEKVKEWEQNRDEMKKRILEGGSIEEEKQEDEEKKEEDEEKADN